MKYEKLHLKEYYDFLGQNDADPVLEIYLPYNMTEMNRQNQKRPCMVVCPGGGYWACSQRESEPIALHFLPEGFNVFVLTYSTTPHRFPTAMREVAAVMELIYKNADEWNCDTEKVAIIGFSAGGHLAAYYSNMYDCKEVREAFPESKADNAALLSYPVITADPKVAHKGSFENLLGHYPEGEELEYFSCDCQVDENTPPTFIWHTAEDTCVPVENSLRYATALTRNKVPVELHIYPFSYHGLSTCDKQTIDNLDKNIIYNSAWLDNAKKWLKLIFDL